MFCKRFFFISILFWILISINGLCVCWFSEKYLKGAGGLVARETRRRIEKNLYKLQSIFGGYIKYLDQTKKYPH